MRTASKLASAAVFVAFLVLGQVWLLACSVAAIKAVEVLFGDGELQRVLMVIAAGAAFVGALYVMARLTGSRRL